MKNLLLATTSAVVIALSVAASFRMAKAKAPDQSWSRSNERAILTITTKDFIRSLGVNTHIPYTDGGYAKLANIKQNLEYLGLNNLRDSISNGENGSAPFQNYVQLAKSGLKFTFIVGGGDCNREKISNTLDLIKKLIAFVPGSVKYIEGVNEINNQPQFSYNGVRGLEGAVAFQRDLYSMVQNDPTLAQVPVAYFTGYDAGDIGIGPDPSVTSGLADFDNQHPYPNGGQSPAKWVAPSQALGNEFVIGPFIYTETGYSNNLEKRGAVGDVVQAKYLLDLIMDAIKFGSSGTFIYELMDAYKTGSPQGNEGFGLFDEDNKPKVSANAVHNLTSILNHDEYDQHTAVPSNIAYTLSGLPTTGSHLAITEPDGTSVIAVWAQPEIWDENKKAEIPASVHKTTIHLGEDCDVSVYDPMTGSSPIYQEHGKNIVTVMISDHPLLIRVSPEKSIK